MSEKITKLTTQEATAGKAMSLIAEYSAKKKPYLLICVDPCEGPDREAVELVLSVNTTSMPPKVAQVLIYKALGIALDKLTGNWLKDLMAEIEKNREDPDLFV